MALDASIYARFLQPPKSVADYDLEAAQVEGARQTNALNRLRLAAGQRAEADAQRVLGEQTGVRNALSALGAGASDDQRVNALRALGTPTGFSQADALEKSVLERQKTRAEVGSKESESRKRDSDIATDAIKRYRGALDFIDTPQGAARWLQSQYADPALATHMQALGPLEQALARIPQDPQGFAQWRAQAGMGMEKWAEQQRLAATQAETQRHNQATERNAAGQLAVAQGNLGVSRQRLEIERTAPRGQFLETPDGYVLGDPRSGTVAPVMGPGGKQLQGKAADRALTDSQAKANLFGTRMQEADKIITGLEGKYSPAALNAKMGAEGVPLIGGLAGWAGNALMSEEGQQAEQAQRDFINAVLRRESGAVISDQEFGNAKKQYFPQPGDSKAVLDQKRRNRQLATQGLLAEVPAGKRGVTSGSSGDSTGGMQLPAAEAIAAELARRGAK